MLKIVSLSGSRHRTSMAVAAAGIALHRISRLPLASTLLEVGAKIDNAPPPKARNVTSQAFWLTPDDTKALTATLLAQRTAANAAEARERTLDEDTGRLLNHDVESILSLLLNLGELPSRARMGDASGGPQMGARITHSPFPAWL
jgi:hypothetical protein